MRVHRLQVALIVCLCCISALCAWYCAGQIAPPGGPVDLTPPEIIATVPPNKSIHYTEGVVAIEFSEYVNRLNVEQSLFISPYVEGLTFDWGGTDVTLHFSDSLRENTTYVITIGTDATDIHNNRMKNAASFAFSTGDHIDSGFAAGKVFDAKPEGVLIYAYQLDNKNADTLNPEHIKPDYLTQTGKDGSFTLSYLALGKYRIIAIRDEYKNLLYNPQIDDYGVCVPDVSLEAHSSNVSGLQFQLSKEDITPPFLSSAIATDNMHIVLRFSEAVMPTSLLPENITLIDTTSHREGAIIHFSFIGDGFNIAQLVTQHQDSGHVYILQIRNVSDFAGNTILDSNSIAYVTSEGVPDTSRPRIFLVQHSGRSMLATDSLFLQTTEAVYERSCENGIRIEDTLKERITGTMLWKQNATVVFVPSEPWKYGMTYRLSVLMDSVLDYAGNRAADTVWHTTFSIISKDSLSSIKGTIVDENLEGQGPIVLVAQRLGDPTNPVRLAIPAPGPFIFQSILEGRYTLRAFRDRDENTTYTYGKLFPFQSSERFVQFSDTVKVRARWPLEGVLLRLPK